MGIAVPPTAVEDDATALVDAERDGDAAGAGVATRERRGDAEAHADDAHADDAEATSARDGEDRR